MPAPPPGQPQNSVGRQSPNPFLAAGNSHALPTFSVNRSSSSILKQVLREEEQRPNQ